MLNKLTTFLFFTIVLTTLFGCTTPSSTSATPTSGALNASVGLPPKESHPCANSDYPCFDDKEGWEKRIVVPEQFSAEYFALLPEKPTSITFHANGLLYAATMEGSIYELNQQGEAKRLYHGLDTPVGTAFQPDTKKLYISDRVSMEEGRVGYLDVTTGEYTVLVTGIPCCYASMHSANGLAFGKDGYLYLAVGAQSDHGEVLNTDVQAELHPWEGTILRISADGKEIKPYARGIRNAYDIAWDGDWQLFATNNGADFGPPDTLHHILPDSENGFPWFVCDRCFGPAPKGITIVPPVHEFPPHVAPTGITAYLAEQFLGYYNNLFVVLWSAFEGAQKVVRFAPGGGASADFATGFAAPIDLTVSPDGSLFVADWATGILFKIAYTP